MYPSFFISHGTPAYPPDCFLYFRFLHDLGDQLPPPRGIVVFSSHWESPVQQVTGASRMSPMQSVFPSRGAVLRGDYSPQGDIVLTLDMQRLLTAEGIDCRIDDARGLDDGVWPILSLLFPEANVPVVCASIHPKRAPEDSYRIGKAIGELRQSGYLIVGSGATVRNLNKLEGKHAEPADWAILFNGWLDEHIQVWDLDALFEYDNRAPYALQAVPSPGHLAPLFICMGTADMRKRVKLLHQEYVQGSLSLNCWMFG